MKILYGVQATGNGHITRARAMSEAFNRHDADVDYLFTGRPKEKLFDMEPFGDYSHLTGLTFITDHGRINYLKSAIHNHPLTALHDVKSLNLEKYDLVITDFEPISAWAAKKKGIPSLGISHQYSFKYPIPKSKENLVAKAVFKYFAPADNYLGVHWHHFDQPILPPISQPVAKSEKLIKDKVLVYLPFFEKEDIINALTPVKSHQFYIYCDVDRPEEKHHLHIRPFSRKGFHTDLADCASIICNTGFTLISEALQYGKNILTVPVQGQTEQTANAEALIKLNLATTMNELDSKVISNWLADSANQVASAISYPDVSEHIVKWILNGMEESKEELVKNVWRETSFIIQD